MVMFRQPADVEGFEDSYASFLALVERMPGIQRRQVSHPLGSPTGPPRYYRVLELYYPDENAMRASLESPRGQEAAYELANFGDGAFEMFYAEVYEEGGASTPPAQPDDNASSGPG